MEIGQGGFTKIWNEENVACSEPWIRKFKEHWNIKNIMVVLGITLRSRLGSLQEALLCPGNWVGPLPGVVISAILLDS